MLDRLFTPEEVFDVVAKRLPQKLAEFDLTEKGVLGMFDALAHYCEEHAAPEGFSEVLDELWEIAEGRERHLRIYVTTRLLRAAIALGEDPAPYVERMDLGARHVAACDWILPLDMTRQLLEDVIAADDEEAGPLAELKLRQVIEERERTGGMR